MKEYTPGMYVSGRTLGELIQEQMDKTAKFDPLEQIRKNKERNHKILISRIALGLPIDGDTTIQQIRDAVEDIELNLVNWRRV
jgi:hypothetical protein